MRKILRFLVFSIVTCGGLGWSWGFPGTVGSVGAALSFSYLLHLVWPWYVWLVLISGLYVAGSWATSVVLKRTRVKDPSFVVIDEWVAMWAVCWLMPSGLWWHVAGFVLFRFFDVAKPGVVAMAERLPGHWGVMLDDMVAAVYTIVLIRGIYFLHSWV